MKVPAWQVLLLALQGLLIPSYPEQGQNLKVAPVKCAAEEPQVPTARVPPRWDEWVSSQELKGPHSVPPKKSKGTKVVLIQRVFKLMKKEEGHRVSWEKEMSTGLLENCRL